METEIFRITPEEGKSYEYAECTRKEGKYPNERYYTTKSLQFVGKFIKHESTGYRDNAHHWDVFENGVVHYSYSGNTCFRVCPCQPDKVSDTIEVVIQ